MNALIVAGLLLILLGISYQSGWSKSRALATAGGVKVHSRPQYHGSFSAIWTMVPALVVLLLWAWLGGGITHDYIVSLIPHDVLTSLDQMGLNATIGRIQSIASGYGVAGEVADGRPQKYFGSSNGWPMSCEPTILPSFTIRLPFA